MEMNQFLKYKTHECDMHIRCLASAGHLGARSTEAESK